MNPRRRASSHGDEDEGFLSGKATSLGENGARDPRRGALVFLCSLCTALSYCDRVNMSVGIIDMAKELNWDMTEKSAVLSAFFYGYIWSQIPGAYIAKRYGGHIVLGVCALMWSLATLAVPYLATISHHHVMMGRMALGVFEGSVFPTIYHLFSSRIPQDERSRSLASISIGVFGGAVFSFVASPLIMQKYGWQAVFYFFGGLGVIWSVAWFAFCIFLESRGGNDIPLPCFPTLKAKVPLLPMENSTSVSAWILSIWKATTNIVCHKVVVAIFFSHFCHNVGAFVVMSWLPTFFDEAFGMQGSTMTLTCLPYIAMANAVTLTAKYADRYISNGKYSLCEVRRASTLLGFIGAGTFMMLVAVSPGPATSIASICIALAFNGAGPVAGYEAAKLDVASPELVGALQSISNTLAAFAGIVGVPMVAYIKAYTGGWTGVFVAIGLVFYSAALVFYQWGHYKGKVVK
mmetsp:Transcript_11267/g.20828  ORF Transcript_11267/g.20828 Transcript_11267/m.20828 type:complete len:462 (+) Transcript_11267:83-1468(+)